eukprot:CAMPEP_0202894868 /NCGR_PEP_ID=MMETSP1392-20130828/4167_1 /ASSEMBLY_ACC=CAM_ASM_000868 /TAXON_ID=225041 /ORGANISM="Chlamydomonas chlamydogama, Strain SAG 11-48b" /LENGTH=184 /DNA_ID=CAMNT_0049579685 /DNA_START=46 /DNA_END=601 /DNA_ORIENTATION=-
MTAKKGLAPGSPLIRYFTLVLTNGATLRLPTVTERSKPLFSNFDIFNHTLWDHKIKTEASLEAEKNFLPDMSDYYSKFTKDQARKSIKASGKQTGAAASKEHGRIPHMTVLKAAVSFNWWPGNTDAAGSDQSHALSLACTARCRSAVGPAYACGSMLLPSRVRWPPPQNHLHWGHNVDTSGKMC